VPAPTSDTRSGAPSAAASTRMLPNRWFMRQSSSSGVARG
jgi:hypothetical protein